MIHFKELRVPSFVVELQMFVPGTTLSTAVLFFVSMETFRTQIFRIRSSGINIRSHVRDLKVTDGVLKGQRWSSKVLVLSPGFNMSLDLPTRVLSCPPETVLRNLLL